ncbi:hypothetical protein CC2G_009977 [Coprinopsis cinerea AmutBmut pab1-1]|nr:hypothetical protein CC2G_009977 [Coprinopsis cinerea AmutBmut pab1-1]
MTLSRGAQKYPSFSMALTTAPDGTTTVTLEDQQAALERHIIFNPPTPAQAGDHNEAYMKTIDTRFENNLAYSVVYRQDDEDEGEHSDTDTFAQHCEYKQEVGAEEAANKKRASISWTSYVGSVFRGLRNALRCAA